MRPPNLRQDRVRGRGRQDLHPARGRLRHRRVLLALRRDQPRRNVQSALGHWPQLRPLLPQLPPRLAHRLRGLGPHRTLQRRRRRLAHPPRPRRLPPPRLLHRPPAPRGRLALVPRPGGRLRTHQGRPPQGRRRLTRLLFFFFFWSFGPLGGGVGTRRRRCSSLGGVFPSWRLSSSSSSFAAQWGAFFDFFSTKAVACPVLCFVRSCVSPLVLVCLSWVAFLLRSSTLIAGVVKCAFC
mmetsp:Transcript_13948/g.42188  ORF Transcript_13948/g.42188 Transcript_13948/m.42188 type:complete len:238 (-) Transcript_13948:15-728(-)